MPSLAPGSAWRPGLAAGRPEQHLSPVGINPGGLSLAWLSLHPTSPRPAGATVLMDRGASRDGAGLGAPSCLSPKLGLKDLVSILGVTRPLWRRPSLLLARSRGGS